MSSEPTLYANVWLKPAANLTQVQNFFRGAGFNVMAGSGEIFTIAGNKALFEGVFGETLSVRTTDDSGVSYTVATTQTDPLTLPLLRLPDEIKTRLNTVTFDEPPDFGPVSYE